jgi:hypothetical protein
VLAGRPWRRWRCLNLIGIKPGIETLNVTPIFSMFTLLRPLAQRPTVAARRIPKQCSIVRAFHSPFVVLNEAPTSHEAQARRTEAEATTFAYEKQYDFSYEPLSTGAPFGNRIFVVSQPDASARHYKVPSGVYPVSLPFSSPETNIHRVCISCTITSPSTDGRRSRLPPQWHSFGLLGREFTARRF